MNAIENGQLCKYAEQALRDGIGLLTNVPGLIKKIITTQAWEEREVGPGRVVKLGSLIELITTEPLDGWGEDPKKIESLLKDDEAALILWRDALRHQGKRTDLGGDGNFHYNVMEVDSPYGNTKSYALSRLKRDAPEGQGRHSLGQRCGH